MIIECSNCHARYQYDESRFERKPSKKIKCAKCATVFEIHNPAYAPPSAAEQAGDSTNIKREARMPEPEPEVEQPKPSATSAALKMPAGKRLSLAIIDGKDAGAVHRVEKPRVTIGRTGADINLNDTEASRAHAAVEIRETEYTLRDLKSTNGTLVDGEKIVAPVELQNHSEFQIGSTTIMLIVTDDV